MKSSTDTQVCVALQVSKQNLEETYLMLREVNKSVPVFFTKMDPCYLFNVGNATSRKPVEDLSNTIVLCVSAIGSANAFAKGIEKVSFSILVVGLNLVGKYVCKHICVCIICSIKLKLFLFLEVSIKLHTCPFLLRISFPNGNYCLQIGAFYVDRLEFSDHHKFLAKVEFL